MARLGRREKEVSVKRTTIGGGFDEPEAKGIGEAGIIVVDARQVIGSLVTSCRLVN